MICNANVVPYRLRSGLFVEIFCRFVHFCCKVRATSTIRMVDDLKFAVILADLVFCETSFPIEVLETDSQLS